MGDYVPNSVLGRAMLLLNIFTADDSALPLVELVRRTGLPKTTAYRLSRELEELGLLGRDRQGRYRLGRHLFELGMRASSERQLVEVAMPFLQDLYVRTLETVHLGVLENNEVVYISKIGGHRQARAPSRIGGRMPTHCTAIGKILLAFSEPEVIHELLSDPLSALTPRTITAPGILKQQLTRALKEGVAYEFEESSVGLTCVAAPILDPNDQPIAAVSVAGSAIRFKPENHAHDVRTAAAGIVATLARRHELTH